MARFVRELAITSETRVLDVGGTPETWDLAGVRPRVTLLNTARTRDELAAARRRSRPGPRGRSWPTGRIRA